MEDKREKSLAKINAEYQSLIKEDREAEPPILGVG